MTATTLGLFDFVSIMAINSTHLIQSITDEHMGSIPYFFPLVHTIPGEDEPRYEMIEDIKAAEDVLVKMKSCMTQYLDTTKSGRIQSESLIYKFKTQIVPFFVTQQPVSSTDEDGNTDVVLNFEDAGNLEDVKSEMQNFKNYIDCLTDIDINNHG